MPRSKKRRKNKTWSNSKQRSKKTWKKKLSGWSLVCLPASIHKSCLSQHIATLSTLFTFRSILPHFLHNSHTHPGEKLFLLQDFKCISKYGSIRSTFGKRFLTSTFKAILTCNGKDIKTITFNKMMNWPSFVANRMTVQKSCAERLATSRNISL